MVGSSSVARARLTVPVARGACTVPADARVGVRSRPPRPFAASGGSSGSNRARSKLSARTASETVSAAAGVRVARRQRQAIGQGAVDGECAALHRLCRGRQLEAAAAPVDFGADRPHVTSAARPDGQGHAALEPRIPRGPREVELAVHPAADRHQLRRAQRLQVERGDPQRQVARPLAVDHPVHLDAAIAGAEREPVHLDARPEREGRRPLECPRPTALVQRESLQLRADGVARRRDRSRAPASRFARCPRC